jgi:U6 snRNA-associated Sm-like protein LSm1
LEDTVERIYHQDVFAEQWVGLFLIRGENVVLLGEIVSITENRRFLSQILTTSSFFLGS